VLGTGDGVSNFKNSGQVGSAPWSVFTDVPAYVDPTSTTWNATNANNWTNTNAWVRIQEPSPSVREWTIQRSNNGTSSNYGVLTIRFAPLGFGAGGASATVVPNAAGSVAVVSNGAQFGDGLANNAGADLYLNISVATAAEAQNVWPWSFWIARRDTGVIASGFFYEFLENTESGDAQPWAQFGNSLSSWGTKLLVTNALNNAGSLITVQDPTSGLGTTGGICFAFPSSTTLVPGADGKTWDVVGAVYSMPAAGTVRRKGTTKYLRWVCNGRQWPNTKDLASTSPFVHLGEMIVPWAQSVTVLSV
jgi:hypothetical protein